MRVLLLAGGFGTRLAKVVKDTPKPMAKVAGRPFLEYQIQYLKNQGFTSFTLLTGYLSEQIESHFGDGSRFGVQISYSVEREPLGTGGAIRQAIENSPSPEQMFLVLNGDCMFATDYKRLVHLFQAPMTLGLKFSQDLSRYGSVDIDAAYKITGFREKSPVAGEGYINAGAYVIHRRALDHFPHGKFSIETEVFQPLSARKIIGGVPCGGKFVDIGTPESFEWAQKHLPAWLGEKFKPCLFLDRDGVLIHHQAYLCKPSDVRLVSEVVSLLREAKARGWYAAVITNQSGVARGLFSEADCESVHRHIDSLLAAEGLSLDGWFASYCHPDGKVEGYCRESFMRKPKAGMVLSFCEKMSVDLSRSLMLGDNVSDQIELPDLRTVLVQGDFPLKRIEAGTVVSESFPALFNNAMRIINGLS